MKEPRPTDEIIAEVRAIRERIAARHGFDLERLYREAKRREEAAERELLEPAPKRIAAVSNR